MKKHKKTALKLITGSLCGFVNGFFGGGGGTIAVIMLTMLLNYDEKNAHATALAVILPPSIVAAISYVAAGSFDKAIGLPVTLGFTVGGVLGALTLKKIKAAWLPKIFAFVLLAAGVKLTFF